MSMENKFAKRDELCKWCKNEEIWCDYVVMEDIFVLWDTVQELHNNLHKFFNAWWKRIQLTDWITIEMWVQRKII